MVPCVFDLSEIQSKTMIGADTPDSVRLFVIRRRGMSTSDATVLEVVNGQRQVISQPRAERDVSSWRVAQCDIVPAEGLKDAFKRHILTTSVGTELT
jgi:hypothetical protein